MLQADAPFARGLHGAILDLTKIQRPQASLLQAMVNRLQQVRVDDGSLLLLAASLASRLRNSADQEGAVSAAEQVDTIILTRFQDARAAEHGVWLPIRNASRVAAAGLWDRMHTHARHAWVGHHTQLDGDAHAWEYATGPSYPEFTALARHQLELEQLQRHPAYSVSEEAAHHNAVATLIRASRNARSPTLAPIVCEWLEHHSEQLAAEAAGALTVHPHRRAETAILNVLDWQLRLPDTEAQNRKPKLTNRLLRTLLSWEATGDTVLLEAARHLLRQPAYANAPVATCTSQCVANCNPHRLQACRTACQSRCNDNAVTAGLLKQLAQRAAQDPTKREKLQKHIRRHLSEAHASHHAVNTHASVRRRREEYDRSNTIEAIPSRATAPAARREFSEEKIGASTPASSSAQTAQGARRHLSEGKITAFSFSVPSKTASSTSTATVGMHPAFASAAFGLVSRQLAASAVAQSPPPFLPPSSPMPLCNSDFLTEPANTSLCQAGFTPWLSEFMSYFFRRTMVFYESVDLDESSSTVDVRASMRYLAPITLLPDVIEMTAHPLEGDNHSGAGPLFDFRVQGYRVGSKMKVNVSRMISAGFHFLYSGMYSSIPNISLSGDTCFDASYLSATALKSQTRLHMSTNRPWNPLPDVLPWVEVPPLYGKVTFDIGDSMAYVTVDATHDPLDSGEMPLLPPELPLKFTDMQVALSMDFYLDWSTLTALLTTTPAMPPYHFYAPPPAPPPPPPNLPPPRVILTLNATAVLGGDDGIIVTTRADFAPMQKAVDLALTHAGGWSPLAAGALQSIFTTPTFGILARFTVDDDLNVHMKADASARYSQPIELLPRELELVPHPNDTKAAPDDGPAFQILIEAGTAAGAASDFVVNFQAGFRIVLAEDSFPIIAVEGRIQPRGLSSLAISTWTPWTPLPDLAPCLEVPPMYGKLEINSLRSELSLYLTHQPITYACPLALDELVLLYDLQVQVWLDGGFTGPTPSRNDGRRLVENDGTCPIGKKTSSVHCKFRRSNGKRRLASGSVDLTTIASGVRGLPGAQQAEVTEKEGSPGVVEVSIPVDSGSRAAMLSTLTGALRSKESASRLFGTSVLEAPNISFFQWFDMSSVPEMYVKVTGRALFGVENPLELNVSAAVDTGTGWAELGLYHDCWRCWSPLPAVPELKTPRFSGVLSYGGNGSYYLKASVHATYDEPLELIPDVLTFGGGTLGTISKGPSLLIQLEQFTRTSSPIFFVNFSGSIRVSAGKVSPPVILVNGTLFPCGTSSLSLETLSEWQPLPDAFPMLRVPRLRGNYAFRVDGAMELTASHEPLPDLGFAGFVTVRQTLLTLKVTGRTRASSSLEQLHVVVLHSHVHIAHACCPRAAAMRAHAPSHRR